MPAARLNPVTRVRRSAVPRPPGRPRAKSNLPAPIPGQPFSLLATLRRTRGLLTVEDVATITGLARKTVYARIREGKIPAADLGLDVTRIDPAAWALVLEHDNPHLKPSARAATEAAA